MLWAFEQLHFVHLIHCHYNVAGCQQLGPGEVFSSPNFPEPYPANSDECFKVRVDQGKVGKKQSIFYFATSK